MNTAGQNNPLPGPSRAAQYRFFFSLLRADRRGLALAALVFVIKHSPVWIIPVITRNIINIVSAHPPDALRRVLLNGLVLGLLYLQNIPMNAWYVKLLSTCNRSLELRLRGALVAKLQELAISYHDEVPAGKLQSKLLRDVEMVQQLIDMLYTAFLQSAASTLFALGVTLHGAPKMALFYVATIPVAALLIKAFRGRISLYTSSFRTEVEEMSARLNDMLTMLPVTRAHGVEQTEIARVRKHLDRVRASGMHFDIIMNLFGSFNWAIFGLFGLLALLVSAVMALHGQLTPGDVLMYSAFFGMILNAVSVLLTAYPQFARGVESIRSIHEVIDSPDIERNTGKAPVDGVSGEFIFEAVSYQYPGAPRPAVADFNLTIRPGESVAFVGESGSGKSTLINLIIGFRRPTAGRILLDRRDMELLDLRTVRQHFAVVTQNTVLFSGSVRENISYGLDGATTEAVTHALEQANAMDFVRALPGGIDALIGEQGGKLSGGQRQRLAIARALLRNPRVLILDEATSALDAAAERQVQEALERLMHGRTTFIVAHRFTTIRKAGRIVVMRHGSIAECGTYEQLYAARGEFYRLARLQHEFAAGEP